VRREGEDGVLTEAEKDAYRKAGMTDKEVGYVQSALTARHPKKDVPAPVHFV